MRISDWSSDVCSSDLYTEFASQQKDLPPAQRLKIGLIYSFAANEGETDGLLSEEEFETEGLDQGSRDFLDAAIRDYNSLFATNFDTSADKFQNYYKDLSQRDRKSTRLNYSH